MDLLNFSNYTSNRVFAGVRVLTSKEDEEHRARLKRAISKLKKKDNTMTDGGTKI